LPDPPQVVNSFELQAINDPATGKGAFLFEGHEVPPVVRAVPGGVIQLEYANQMSRNSSEVCVDGPCMNMTNLHFHGLHVSPDAPGDDVLTMMAMPGESLHYTVDIPADMEKVISRSLRRADYVRGPIDAGGSAEDRALVSDVEL
jgi:suppressor of ftsI